MATDLLLVRHARHDRVDRILCGRLMGVSLSDEGRADAQSVADLLARRNVAAVYTSPMQRCRETAEPIARGCGVTAEIEDSLIEIDFGRWTGTSFDELDDDPVWHRWNQARDLACAPGGEAMRDVQARAIACLWRIRDRHPERTVALVTHGDVIKSILLQFLGLKLQAYDRLEISPASITTLAVWPGGGKLIRSNEMPAGSA